MVLVRKRKASVKVKALRTELSEGLFYVWEEKCPTERGFQLDCIVVIPRIN